MNKKFSIFFFVKCVCQYCFWTVTNQDFYENNFEKKNLFLFFFFNMDKIGLKTNK